MFFNICVKPSGLFKLHFLHFISPNKYLFKAIASARSIAGWDPRYETIDVPGDCGFYF